jgi:Fe-S-cluster-containing dehydrogenase component
MSQDRRSFIKSVTLTGATVLAGNELLASDKINSDNSYAVLVDTVVCIGCRKCEWACNDYNKLANKPLASFEDKSVLQDHRRPTASAYTVINKFDNPQEPEKMNTIKIQCMHCNHPACVSACIVGAFRKNPDGPVTYDAWKCIGCRYCMVACPFQIPAYEYDNALDPQVRKCGFCADRIASSQKPACVGICPNEALTFGTRRELLEMAHSRINANPDRYFNHIYGETEAGGTCWLYLAAVDFSQTELPMIGDRPIPEATEPIQHGIFKSFVPPLALYGLLGMAMYNFRNRKEIGDDSDDDA